MSKKQDAYYFDNFYTCADYACQAAHLLDKVLRDFNPERIKEKLDEMHEVEHSADEKKHDLLNVLTKAFITPLGHQPPGQSSAFGHQRHGNEVLLRASIP